MVVERIVKKHIIYAGISDPKNSDELRVEILGLRNAIKQAEELISRYEQVFAVSELKNKEMQNAPQTKSNTETQEGAGRKGEEKPGASAENCGETQG